MGLEFSCSSYIYPNKFPSIYLVTLVIVSRYIMSDGDVSVYVGSLSYNANEDDLQKEFEKYGNVTNGKCSGL